MKAMKALLVMTLAVAAVVAFPASNVTAGKCSVGSNDLCSCSQLIAKKIIKGLDDCTQEVAIAACKDGKCSNDFAMNTTLPDFGGCESKYTQAACDGKKDPMGRRLLGGGGGGSCVWCKSNDGAHAECFYKSKAKALPAGKWTCDKTK